MTNALSRLRGAETLTDLALILNYKPKSLAYIIYKIPDISKYNSFSIPKKSGGLRQIDAPIPQLKLLQARLSNLLQDCLQTIEHIEEVKLECSLSHGFHRGRSIISNAQRHKGRAWVFNLDLEDFFPSINFGRVRGYFQKNRHFKLNERISTIIAQIACSGNTLPQGSPSSPVISNLIASQLDICLSKIAKNSRCSYTRYADDLTFSSSTYKFISEIADKLDESGAWRPSDKVRYNVNRMGFSINEKKSRMQLFNSRQDTTGIIVNKKLNIKREYVKIARATCHHLFTTGSCTNKGRYFGIDIEENFAAAKLVGMYAHIFRVKGIEYDFKRQRSDRKTWPAFYRDYENLLDYLSFYGNRLPTVLCEGKTDNIYLKYAIKSMALEYPQLIDLSGNQLCIKLFNYTKSSDAIQSLSGGTGDLKEFIFKYSARLRRFSVGHLDQPVIIVVDNDKGAAEIYTAIKKVSLLTAKVDGTSPFYHVIHNLYVVPTPTPTGLAESCIETLLPISVLNEKIGNRSYHPEIGFDPAKHFGKAWLAEKIVAKKYKSISFAGFKLLLDNIGDVILDYEKRIKAKGGFM